MSEPIIQLHDIARHYGEVTAVDGITCDIAQGEFFSLLGPSGCGKTTLLRLIAGFEQPTAGRVTIDGKPMAGVPPNHRPTNMVFQSYAIFPHLNVGQNVSYGLKKQSLDRDEVDSRVAEVLEMVDMAGYEPRAATALSGGQKQRVALARALVMRPKVLLLDEPLSALDKKLREQMQVELRHLQRAVGITFILVTHDQEEALIMSDRIAVMFEGQIAQLASPQELYRRPNSRQVASFIGIMNFFRAEVKEANGTGTTLDIAALGEATVGQDNDLRRSQGREATVGIRPEMLTILFDDEKPNGRHVEGEVVDTNYFGDMTYYDVQLEGAERPATISMRNTAGRRVLQEGERARIGWSEESVVVLD